MNILSKFDELDDKSKKLIKIGGIGLIVFIILIIILSITISILLRKTPYYEVEEIMQNAAYKYYKNNPGELPTAEVNTVVISVDSLVEQEYMKPLSKYTKNDTCSGNVVVTYMDSDYDYQAYLTCNDFETSLLVDKIKKDNTIVTTGNGLYDENGLLRFRGEFVNNYINIDDVMYRIIKIDSENKIYIMLDFIKDSEDELRSYWDDRYNTEIDSSCGINDYSVSRVRDSLSNIYRNMKPQLKQNLTTFNACTGVRAKDNMTNDGSLECVSKIENEYITLLPLYEYMKASVSGGCVAAKSKECKNYNYLVMDSASWWLQTPTGENTSDIYYVSSSGLIDKDKGNNKKVARYMVALKPNVLLYKGNGTQEKPYQIR